MATKTSLLSAINTQLTAIITKDKHRLSMSLMLDELYPSVISDTQSTTNVLTAINSTDRTYNLKIVKQGRCVTIKGRIKNNTTSIISNVPFFNITNSDFYPIDATYYNGVGQDGTVRFVLSAGNEFSILDSMPAEAEIDINFTYFTSN